MNSGTTYVEVNYDLAWVNSALERLSGFSWLFEWGMYLFLILAVGIVFWIFYDSITKKKDQKALIPRILSMVGAFAIIPAFIFRFTGNTDPNYHQLRLGADPVTPICPLEIHCNAQWLCAGYGPMIAMLALAGVLCAIVAVVIYASSVQRSKPSTEFVQAFNSKMDSLESKVEDAKRNAAAANAAAASAVASGAQAATAATAAPKTNATIIDRKPQAATIIDVPKSGDTLSVQSGANSGKLYDLPMSDVVIGRDTSSFIVLDDGKVSSKHLRLSYNQGNWSATDMGSTNGTYVNGQRIAGQVALNNGDTIKIGDTVFAFGKAF